MSLFDCRGLAVSIPGTELVTVDLPASIVGMDDVLSGSISIGLRAALVLIEDECRRRQVPLRVVARPEIFTNLEAERWLRERLGQIEHHLCVSDGTTIKSVPGCETHVFFYSLHRADNFAAVRRLSKRAPELVASVRSQINTSLALGLADHRFVPEPIYIPQRSNLPRPLPRLMPFYLNKHSAQDTANRIEQRGEQDATEFAIGDKEIVYIPLTETALLDRGFAYSVGTALLEAFFRPDLLLLLRLPPARDCAEALRTQIEIFVLSLRRTGLTFPQSCPPNVLLATDDLTEDSPLLSGRPWRLIIHESFDFWRLPERFYAAADRIAVMETPHDASTGSFMPLNVAPLLGPNATRVWLHRPD